jgi:hypothetical protein
MTWSKEKYFNKSCIYWMKSSEGVRDSDEYLLHVALASEFIVRGALCFVDASLNASLDEKSILYAAGVQNETPRTIDIGAALNRLSRFIPSISPKILKSIDVLFQARNRELHSDLSELSSISKDEVMPYVYMLFVECAKFTGTDLSTVLGEGDAKQAEKVATAAMQDRKQRVSSRISDFRERFKELTKEEQEIRKQSVEGKIVYAALKSGHQIKSEICPACSNSAFLIGIPVGSSVPLLKDGEIIREIRVMPTQFECKCCGLEIKGLDELIAANFSHEFCTIDSIDPVEHFEIDPNEFIDYMDTDIIRTRLEREYDYQDE